MPLWHEASSSCQVLRPVRTDARHGLHFGFEVKAFLKSTPSCATRSKFGVFTQSQPYAPACARLQSSKMMKRIFGGRVSAAGEFIARNRRKGRKRRRFMRGGSKAF